jgi:gliding motility-associated-like protein
MITIPKLPFTKAPIITFLFAVFFLMQGIQVNAQTVLKVGSNQTYTTIAAARSACSNSTIDYIIEITPFYSSITEGFPIVFSGNNTYKSITVRPEAGNANFNLIPSTNDRIGVFAIQGSRITIDGRPGGTGTTGLMTIGNTNPAVSYVINMSNNFTNNTISYCIIKCSNAGSGLSDAAIQLDGTTGNTNIKILNCNIQNTNSGQQKCTAIYSSSADYVLIDQCNFIDFSYRAINVTANPKNWTVQNNSFYQTTLATSSGNVSMIRISDGNAFTFKNNYIGGTAPQCGGVSYKLSGVNSFTAIELLDGTGTVDSIYNNTIKNISISAITSVNTYCFEGASLKGGIPMVCCGNTIRDIAIANTSAPNLQMVGIYFNSVNPPMNSSLAEKNHITALSNGSDGGQIVGMQIVSSTVQAKNNIIILDNNGGNPNTTITGLYDKNSSNPKSIVFNTIKISGSQTSTTSSAAIEINSNQQDNIKFNIFQNLRTGSATAYAEKHTNGSVLSDSNYIETTASNVVVCYKNSTNYSYANWKATVSSGSIVGTTTIDALGKITSTPFAGAGQARNTSVPTDFFGTTRNSTYAWIGAYEGAQVMTGQVSASNLCAGSTITFPFTLYGTITSGYSYIAQLSDANGSFLSPQVLTINSITGGVIDTQIPIGTPAGIKYRIRVITSVTGIYGSDNGTDLAIKVAPSVIISTPSTIICENESATFTATPVNAPGGATYQWLKNGNLIPGAIQSTCTQTSLIDSDKIEVKINTPTGCGTNITVTSLPIIMTVNSPVITPSSPIIVTVNMALTQAFAVSNIINPTWSTTTITIPQLTLSSSGVLTGSITSIGTYTYNITVQQQAGQCKATKDYTINVVAKTSTWNGSAWSNGIPDSGTDAIFAGDYTTTDTEVLNVRSITVNSGSTLNIKGTANVSATNIFTNNGITNKKCSATLTAGTIPSSNNAVVVIQPIISPSFLDVGRVTTPYSQTTPFSVSFGTAPVFSIPTLPSGLSLTNQGNQAKITGTPTIAGSYTITVNVTDGSTCTASTSMNLRILDLANPKLKFAAPSYLATHAKDTLVTIKATSLSTGAISYSINPASNGCVSLVNGKVKITCVPTTDVWLVASQMSTPQYYGSKDSIKIIVNKATPKVSLITQRGLLLNATAPFAYKTPTDYTGTGTYEQVEGFQVADLDQNGIITALTEGDYQINLVLTETSNYLSFDTTFNLSVYRALQAPQAVSDTIVLIRDNDVIADGTIAFLLNDYGVTGDLQISFTDIDIINPGIQNIFYNPSIGTFDLDILTGILTIRPRSGLTGTTKMGYTITDSDGITSEISYIFIVIENKQEIPPIKANEVMTPNNDGNNDVLFIGYTDLSKNNSIMIMDEVGNEIYKTSNYQNDWAGVNKNGEPLEPGIYYFIFTEEDGNGQTLNGYIQIVR